MNPVLRRASYVLLSISAFLGLVRGYRMIFLRPGSSYPLLFLYSDEAISGSIFSNYAILGWILFSLVGIFSLLVIISMLCKMKQFAYLLIIEGIFLTFLCVTHILMTSFSFIHLFVMPICIAQIILGVMQTPREF